VLRDRYQRSLDASADYFRRHPWWLRLTRTPFSAKMTKYAVGSVIAFVTGNIFFAVVYWITDAPIAASVAGFISAAIPNWILNRRWAWQQTGRPPAKQWITYALVSAVVLFTTSYATKWTNQHVVPHVSQHHGLRILVVTAAYVLVTVVLFFAKFAIYEFWVFSERSRVRATFRRLITFIKGKARKMAPAEAPSSSSARTVASEPPSAP
jgi:putative flippase GtrA